MSSDKVPISSVAGAVSMNVVSFCFGSWLHVASNTAVPAYLHLQEDKSGVKKAETAGLNARPHANDFTYQTLSFTFVHLNKVVTWEQG